MPTHNDILQARGTRDRIIDLLGIGETYPLQDVVVEEADLTVNFEDNSSFDVEPGQKGVFYALYDGVSEDVEHVTDIYPVDGKEGNGEKTTIVGPVIKLDKVFKVVAWKSGWPNRKVFLFDKASIKVGLDTSLDAWIDDKPEVGLLNDTKDAPTDPRIIDYSGSVTVIVAGSQAKADYRLLDHQDNEISTNSVKSTGGEVSLSTKSLTDDVVIRVAVSRTFDESEGEGLDDFPEQKLDVTLPLAVRANPAVDVSIDGGPIVDPKHDVNITIKDTHPLVEYSLYVRTLLDGDFEFVRDPTSDVFESDVFGIRVSAPEEVPARFARVYKPPQPAPLEDGYTRRALKLGTHGDLNIKIEPLYPDTTQDKLQDRIIVIQAQKNHMAALLGQPGTSTLQLQQVLVALARPGPPALTLTPGDTDHTLLVSGGQPGVFYYFRLNGTKIGPPAYFYRPEDRLEDVYPGEHLRIEINFTIARDPPDGIHNDAPLDPLLDVSIDPEPSTELDVMAVKARTGVAWSESEQIQITLPIQPL